jgi:hypothetical protein
VGLFAVEPISLVVPNGISDAFGADTKAIAPRAGGGRTAWFQDPDGNTFVIEADT